VGVSLQDVIPELAELPVVPTLPFTLPSCRVPYFIYKVDGWVITVHADPETSD
jgi:hypothetical protein